MAMGHNPICSCSECETERSSGPRVGPVGGGLLVEFRETSSLGPFENKEDAIAGGVPVEVFAGFGAPGNSFDELRRDIGLAFDELRREFGERIEVVRAEFTLAMAGPLDRPELAAGDQERERDDGEAK